MPIFDLAFEGALELFFKEAHRPAQSPPRFWPPVAARAGSIGFRGVTRLRRRGALSISPMSVSVALYSRYALFPSGRLSVHDGVAGRGLLPHLFP